ncbi:hypothetical protein ADIARSV_1761 [Arcticibacter svalbardensis MN12-7]|uniref:Uncharacterized protein n=1 Tax=Arcticibacter svalbardensis MN12-7 TaxID=1150600 RepID=R9GTM1_9SPHI|nr:hypothetical protein [Arcticibacter svalbardensis]EOR95061.1 hypothetical protein ADIARSV_1761 [Arcticibacter svalbardensis MN12-7]
MRRSITAKGVTTSLTGAQMHPAALYFDAFLANTVLSYDNFFNGLNVAACILIDHFLKFY